MSFFDESRVVKCMRRECKCACTHNSTKSRLKIKLKLKNGTRSLFHFSGCICSLPISVFQYKALSARRGFSNFVKLFKHFHFFVSAPITP